MSLDGLLNELIQDPRPRRVTYPRFAGPEPDAISLTFPSAPLFRAGEHARAWSLVIRRFDRKPVLSDEQERYAQIHIGAWYDKLPAESAYPRFIYMNRDGIQWITKQLTDALLHHDTAVIGESNLDHAQHCFRCQDDARRGPVRLRDIQNHG